jgi:large subunit ribosomal protein L9
MEIILRETIDNLGRAGQVVKVADGYARNYLLPRKLAYLATPGNLKVIEFERQSLLRKEAKQKDDAEKLLQVLEKVEITRSRSGRFTWKTTSRRSASSLFRFASSKTSLPTSN